MLRQNQTPIQYDMTRRPENASILTSGRAGKVYPIAAFGLLRGDSASGRIDIGIELAEMPRPVENAILARAQVWCVPRPAFPQFSGLDEYTHSYQGKDIAQLGAANRTPPSLFNTTAFTTTIRDSEFIKALGIHAPVGADINTDYVDAYNLVQNFRLAAHSSKMTRYNYAAEDADAWDLKPAFWPRNALHNIVPDYEQALVTGSLELDVAAGQIPISGIGAFSNGVTGSAGPVKETDGGTATYNPYFQGNVSQHIYVKGQDIDGANHPDVNAEMTGQTITTSLASIDKARTANAFAKTVAGYAGTDFSGFNNDDVLIADLMQGFRVPEELFNRPWLLDSKTVVFGTQERHASDAANLDDSVTTGYATVSLAVNVPKLDYGGVVIATVELMPERLYERQSDEYMLATSVDDLPSAMRDLLRTEPVDNALNRRVDCAHSTPDGIFGYEPMNEKWKRDRTILGGNFRQLVPGTPNVSARTAIWQADYVDPALTSDHWLCPDPFPQDVFSVPSSDCMIINVRQTVAVTGITQFGDALIEDNGEFLTVKEQE